MYQDGMEKGIRMCVWQGDQLYTWRSYSVKMVREKGEGKSDSCMLRSNEGVCENE